MVYYKSDQFLGKLHTFPPPPLFLQKGTDFQKKKSSLGVRNFPHPGADDDKNPGECFAWGSKYKMPRFKFLTNKCIS